MRNFYFLILIFTGFIFSCTPTPPKNDKLIKVDFEFKKSGNCDFLCHESLYKSEKPDFPKIKFNYDEKRKTYCLSAEDYKKLGIYLIKEKYFNKRLIKIIEHCICEGKIKK
jgi:hypothetical protein